jgi:hypothetical protein
MNDGRRLTSLRSFPVRLGVEGFVFFFAGGALAADVWLRRAWRNGGVGRAHDLVRDAVGFGFEGVVDCADLELGLEMRDGTVEAAEEGLIAYAGRVWEAMA